MLQEFLHIIITSLILMTWGAPLALLLLTPPEKSRFWYHSVIGMFSFLFFCGCITLNIFSSWWVLFAPLNFSTLLFITFFLITGLVVFGKNRILLFTKNRGNTKSTFSFTELIYITVSFTLFIVLGTLKPVNNDTQIYHLQIIKWFSEYGTVPGIANLSPRFGLGSGWFTLIGILEIPVFKIKNFSFLNVSFVCWTFLWLFDKYKYYRTDNSGNSKVLSLYYFALFIYFMVDWQLFRDASNSTNYDFPVTVFTIIIISFFIEEIFKGKLLENTPLLLFLFSFTIISFKFSGIFILILVCLYLLQKRKSTYFFSSAICGLFILLPVCIKNYIITGYPFYPLPLSINKPDWQLPSLLTKGIYRYILNSNRFYNAPFSAEPMENSPLYWVPIWFRGILIQHKLFFFIAVFSIIILSATKPIVSIEYRRLKYLMAALFLMLCGWFFTAPDPGRFGYGILLPVSFLCISMLFYRFIKPVFFTIFLAGLVLGMTYYIYQKGGGLIKEPQYFLLPQKEDLPPFKTKYINGISINVPEIIKGNWNRRCYDIDLPCSCEENPYLQPRGKTIDKGFRMYPEPDSLFAKNYIY